MISHTIKCSYFGKVCLWKLRFKRQELAAEGSDSVKSYELAGIFYISHFQDGMGEEKDSLPDRRRLIPQLPGGNFYTSLIVSQIAKK